MKNVAIILGLFLFGCAPTSTSDSNVSRGLSEEELKERNNECALYNSFAAGNYQNRDYDSAVENYKYMVDIGCSECACLGGGQDAEYIYGYSKSIGEINNNKTLTNTIKSCPFKIYSTYIKLRLFRFR